jgi:hypothetical protein
VSKAGRKPALISDEPSVKRTAEERWLELFGSVPLKRPAGFIEQAVAWQEQAQVHGDVPLHIRRDLEVALAQVRAAREKRTTAGLKPHSQVTGQDQHVAAAPKAADLLPPASSQLHVGARLVKSYGGKTHVVEVTAHGMLYEGEMFRSLSAIAKRITGTHWNGLLFFGLRHRKQYGRSTRDA